jgi:hypothetical protein
MGRVCFRVAVRAFVGNLFSLDHPTAKAHLKHLKPERHFLRLYAFVRPVSPCLISSSGINANKTRVK